MPRLIAEIKRRRVIPVAAWYVVGAWLVLQAADILLPAWGVPPRAIQLIVYAALLGFPIAMLFGWRYDLGPGGITRTLPAGVDQRPDIEVRLSRKDFVLLSLMTLAIVAIGVWMVEQIMRDEPALPTGPPNSVAVLAFEDSGGGDTVAMDLADRIVGTLISVDGLKVTGRESSFYFADRSIPLDEIARMLNVRHLLTGQAGQDGGRLSVSLQLLRMPEEKAIWAQTFVAADEAYGLFGDIARQVAEALRVNVSGEEQQRLALKPAGNREALGLLRLAEQALESGEYERAISLVGRAIELDPNLVRGHVLEALIYLFSFSHTGTPVVETVMRVAGEALDRAESLGAESSDYYYARGMQARRAIWIDGGTPAWHKALEDNFNHAIALNPSDAQPYVSLSIYFRRNRRFNDSAGLLEKALDYDPLHPGAILQYSRNLSALERYEEALEYAMRLPDLFGFGEREIAFRHREFQQLDRAVKWFLKASPDDARNIRDVASLLGRMQAKEEAAAWFAKIADHEIFGPPAQSMIRAVGGDSGVAFRQLAALIDENTANQDWLYYASLMALRSGHAGDAVALLEQMAPSLSDPLAPEVTEQNAEMALLLATALADEEGNEVRTGVLSGMLLNTARNRPAIGWDGVGLRAARVNALQGDIEKAIDAAEASYEQGLRQFYTDEGLLPLPLETLVGNPRFDRLMEQVDADLAAMRERAIKLLDGH